ncbi:hypothetical protein [Flavobacterium sp. MK4S-17]|uniref:hypothetical protein n=1 Tax=Flavobacterium sp. MK4S-17 TaxID=2543737 RepID=UPI00135CEEDA|nr:hypothetical protein [Flavobacterium sp. MK4S-17]
MNKFSLFLCFSLLTLSCNSNQCLNSNDTLENNPPSSQQYINALVSELKKASPSGINYYLEDYREENGKTYMDVKISGDSICAKATLTVNIIDEKLDNIAKTKGMGYRGAELKNLSFTINKDTANNISLIYKDLEKVID